MSQMTTIRFAKRNIICWETDKKEINHLTYRSYDDSLRIPFISDGVNSAK